MPIKSSLKLGRHRVIIQFACRVLGHHQKVLPSLDWVSSWILMNGATLQVGLLQAEHIPGNRRGFQHTPQASYNTIHDDSWKVPFSRNLLLIATWIDNSSWVYLLWCFGYNFRDGFFCWQMLQVKIQRLRMKNHIGNEHRYSGMSPASKLSLLC